MTTISLLEDLSLYQVASVESKQDFCLEGRVFRKQKNEYIFHLRDEVREVYVIRSGYAVLERESEEHGVRNIFVLHPGEIANEVILDRRSASISCSALTDIEIFAIPRDAFLRMMDQDPSLNHYVIESMALKIRKLYHQLESTTKPTKLRHQVASRIWKFGHDYGVRCENYIEIPFEIRITFLAGFVGSNRETVSRTIKTLSDQGILSIQKGICRIYDMDALKNQ